ncbi:DNA-binding response OmpR family regulator OS=Castellaniella defragrans OX=75697 GN=HNR28_002756 PE=4 SV=1 [Castellaniella defragrans]
MRERLDCVLLAADRQAWVDTVASPPHGGRLVLHTLPPHLNTPSAMLADAALLRGRYDAGLIHVDEASLGSWRMALAARLPRHPAMLLVYAVGLRAQAISDLLALGVTDFTQPPFCAEELRARIEHNLLRALPAGVAESPADYTTPGLGQPSRPAAQRITPDTETHLCDTILSRSGTELEAYAVALATQRATSRASFRAAKGEVVARFERAYIRAALGRHSGNITLAAQTAQKHRRAFWALMRKHDIDPTPYRTEIDAISREPSRPA